jgi:acyl-CoA thioesterase FadM
MRLGRAIRDRLSGFPCPWGWPPRSGSSTWIFIVPLHFNESFVIEGILPWTEAARINMEFRIWNPKGELSTSGYTVQVFLDQDQQLMLLPPPFYQAFREKWRAGELS